MRRRFPWRPCLRRAAPFRDVPPELVHELAFWRLTGGEPAGEICQIPSEDIDALADQALNGVLGAGRRISTIRATPYLSQPRPEYAGYGDYDHLARVKEWQGRDDGTG